MQLELQRRDDAEVATATLQRPEQLAMAVCAGVHQPAVGPDDVRTDEAVRRQTVLAQRPADATTKGEAAQPGARNQSAGDAETERLCLVVEVAPRCSALRNCTAVNGVNRDSAHHRQIDDHTAVYGGEAGDAVRAAADRDLQSLAGGELDRADDIRRALTADDERRPLVVAGVPDGPSLVVAFVAGSDDLTLDGRAQLADGGFADDPRPLCRCRHVCLPGCCRNTRDARKTRFAFLYSTICSSRELRSSTWRSPST